MPNSPATSRLEHIDSTRLLRVLPWMVSVALVVVAAVFVVYFLAFNAGLSPKQDVRGQFGDFIGGTLNPILGFLSLIALVLTVTLQVRQLEIAREELRDSKAELAATREELRRSADAQRLTADALAEQARHAATSSKLAALSASLAIATEALERAVQVGAQVGLPPSYQQLVRRKDELEAELLSITEPLLARRNAP